MNFFQNHVFQMYIYLLSTIHYILYTLLVKIIKSLCLLQQNPRADPRAVDFC